MVNVTIGNPISVSQSVPKLQRMKKVEYPIFSNFVLRASISSKVTIFSSYCLESNKFKLVSYISALKKIVTIAGV